MKRSIIFLSMDLNFCLTANARVLRRLTIPFLHTESFPVESYQEGS
jgi:hypothetical protein